MALVIAVSGFKNSGKTTLAMELLRRITEAGFSAAFVKHTHEDVLSGGGTDTSRAVALGVPSLFWGEDGAVLEMTAGSVSREEIDRIFPDKDIVIVEGAKDVPLVRVWTGTPQDVPSGVKGIFAFYNYKGGGGDGVFGPGQEGELAEKILEMYSRIERTMPVALYSGGEKVFLKPFLSGMLAGCLAGLLIPLKGVNLARRGVAIFLKWKR